MSIERVKDYFKKYKKEKDIIELKESSATVADAAKALNTEGARIAKTMSFALKERYILIVLAGDAKISNSKYKAFFHEKAHMLKYSII